MTSDDRPVRGNQMTEDELDDALRDLTHGTLSLARDGEAYGVPISFGYDGERIFLYLIQFGDRSKKIEFSEQTEIASLTAYEANSRFDWKSVIVTGTLHELDEDDVEHMDEVMDDNAWHPSLYASARDETMTGIRRLELRIDSATGRHGEEHLA
jgi:nitroimidazol reductase NimA-like FMN-containing flavoprotein (pyridoxamine 5'-phosphate oxidase superfamily)